jgi:hypothetical protein
LVEKQRHFRLEFARAKDDLVASGRYSRIAGADIFDEGLEDGVFGGRRGDLNVLGRQLEDDIGVVLGTFGMGDWCCVSL